MSLARVRLSPEGRPRRRNRGRLSLAAAVAVLALSACSDGAGDPATTATPGTTPATTPSPTATALADLVVAPGVIGPVSAGMSKDDALATGLFDADVDGVEGCPVAALAWKQAYTSSLDVYTAEDGTVVSLGVRGDQPRTTEGLGVGSTLREISQVHETAEMSEAGFGQTGLFVTDGENWLGFLFDADIDSIARSEPVTFMEVTHGTRPDLMRSGC